MNILIAEDEKDIRNLLKLELEQEGYYVFATKDGIEALGVIQTQTVDLAILDVMMPRLDGFNLLRKIRKASKIPVIFLTAKGDDMDKILGLGIGADDYLVKPFSMAELIARVSAQLRRSSEYSSNNQKELSKIEYGSLCLNKDACCVYIDDLIVELNAKEYMLLKYLMENPERVFSKKQLYKAVWEDEFYYDNNTIMVHISHIRNKIESDPKNPIYIKTIRGIGYKFNKRSGTHL
ncbi:response regulator transcription factor [Clostridium estertheticum]|uniref:response regulator transcription factor n=1 Tax=Clostridium estertheticum TaxID=238834 RepID=UPI001C7DEE8E|nr:response regulator transcription factor [Clostridium estertheticum]MBX4260827.1 response regulator transcription factor [Clostridium estertheticum]MCB2360616.1 response regulator transcription factor [Clostridium estertheticum]WLC71510.1 response regulator transcription factor [Clostridium estertheticum]